MIAGIDLHQAAPTYEALLASAVALGIKATRDEGGSPEAIEYLLRAVVVMACDAFDEGDLSSETVLRTVSSTEGAEHGYRIAYAAELGLTVDELSADLGWYPDGLPLFDGMPITFLNRVARAEAADDRACSEALRGMAQRAHRAADV